MAYIVLTSSQSKLCKVVFKNMTIETAKIIADKMNALAAMTHSEIKLTYKVIGK